MIGSHRLTMTNGKVTIHDLELFVGFDPEIDNPDDEKIKKYDRKKVEAILSRTHEFGERGQNPQLILEHNPTEPDAPGSPVIGNIPHESLHFVEIKGAPGIAGDVVLSREDFESYIRSNRYPRRSAEIWPDGYFSEVAVLSGRTPARPLPDTKFRRNGADYFVRELPEMHVSEYGDPGPTNVNPPSTARKRKMANEHGDEVDKLKARNQELEDEITKLRGRKQKDDDDAKEKEQMMRDASLVAERAQGANEFLESRVKSLEDDNLRQRYGRSFDELDHLGYRVGGVAARAEHMRRIIKAAKDGANEKERLGLAEAEYIYIKGNFHRDPVNVGPIDQQHLRAGTGSQAEQMEKEKEAAKVANLRCVVEGKHDPTTFSRYYEEALAAA